MRTVENFKKENNLTEEMMEVLRDCYESPTNEFNDMPYEEWLYELKEDGVLVEILEDFYL